VTPELAAADLPNHRWIEIWVAIAALVFLAVLVESIRRHRLKERYSLLWFASLIGIGLLTAKREWLEALSYALGIHHTPSALLLVLSGVMMVILFHFSTVISRLLADRNALAQRVGLLDARFRALERELAASRDAGGPSEPAPKPPDRVA
jgi:hypothetical protein